MASRLCYRPSLKKGAAGDEQLWVLRARNGQRMNFAFAAFLVTAGFYFLFRNRQFDLFTIAIGGIAFYFMPLVFGSFPDWNASNPYDVAVLFSQGTYAVGFLLVSAVLGAAIFIDQKQPADGYKADLAP